MNMCVLSASVL